MQPNHLQAVCFDFLNAQDCLSVLLTCKQWWPALRLSTGKAYLGAWKKVHNARVPFMRNEFAAYAGPSSVARDIFFAHEAQRKSMLRWRRLFFRSVGGRDLGATLDVVMINVS
jgi:hypothetical protein